MDKSLKASSAMFATALLGTASVMASCLGPGEAPDPVVEPPSRSAWLLRHEVSPYEAITIRLDEALAQVVGIVVEVEAQPVSVTVSAPLERGASLTVEPRDPWPIGSATVWVTATSRDGGEVVVELPFSVRAQEGNFRPRLLAPLRAQSSPSNLEQLLVEAPMSFWPTDRDVFVVTSSGSVGPAAVLRTSGPRALLQLSVSVEDATVAVSLSDSWLPSAQSASINTSTVSDERAPEVLQAEVLVRGPQAWLSIETTEPVFVLGRVVGQGVDLDLPLPERASTSLHLQLPKMPVFGAAYTVEFWAVDFAGHQSPAQDLEFFIPEPPQVHLQEVVTTPLRDWGDSVANGVPFDEFPGGGAVTDTDEWIEVVNDSYDVVDLVAADLEIRAVGRSVSVTKLVSSPALFFGAGGDLWGWYPQEALVLRTRGSLPQSDVSIELWWGYVQLDRLRLGTGGDHPGGAPPAVGYGALDRTGDGHWRWCSATPGSGFPARLCL